jgi:hypothetical protein
MNISFEEFKKTVYYTEKKIVIPLLNIRLDKIDFITKKVIDPNLVNSAIRKLYDGNIDKFK